MGKTEENRRHPKGRSATPEPEFARIPTVCDRYGLSRTGVYRLAAEGKIRLVKLAGATLVDCGSVRAFLTSLPVAIRKVIGAS